MATRKAMSDKVKHRRGMLRAIGYGTVVGLVCAVVSVRFARAEVIDNSLVIGRQMLELARSNHNDVAYVTMNGQDIIFASQLSHEPPSAILDRYETLCKENAAQSPDQWKDLAKNAAQGSRGKEMAETGGLLRGGSQDEGTVMCFVKSAQSKPTTGEALAALQTTGELGAIGQLRYAYVKKTKGGNTHVLAMWTTEKFNIKEMVPEEGDAPGEDFAELPRPESSRRLFSIKLKGAPYGINIYESDNDPLKLAEKYDHALTKNGWFAIDIESQAKRQEPSLDGVTGRVYEKDGILMTAVSRIEQKKTVTALGIAGTPERVESTQR